jgi:hypothetical protein
VAQELLFGEREEGRCRSSGDRRPWDASAEEGTMLSTFKAPLAFLVLSCLASSPARGLAFGFDCITNNLAGDCAIGEAQLTVDVTDPGNDQILFTFHNAGPDPASITDVYFDDGSLLAIASILGSPPGVAFSEGASPPNLPGGNGVSPPFVTGFSVDSDPPTVASGVDPGESLGILFDLQAGRTFADVLAELEDGTLRIGIHVQGFASGGSESFVVPEPSVLGLGGLGLLGLWHLSRRGARARS